MDLEVFLTLIENSVTVASNSVMRKDFFAPKLVAATDSCQVYKNLCLLLKLLLMHLDLTLTNLRLQFKESKQENKMNARKT